MEILSAQLQTLGKETRLAIFQLLMRRFPQHVASGEIAMALDLKANTCSVHLAALADVGLIVSERSGTHVRYGIAMAGVSALMNNLFASCCNNRPDLCAPISKIATKKPQDLAQRPFNVLFICTGNSARSIMAEQILNSIGDGKFKAYSAGTAPGAAPHPRVLDLLAQKDIPVDGLRSKSTDEFAGPDAPTLDFVFTVCDHAANEECPVWPGQPMSAHWGLADPTKVIGSDSETALALQQAYGLLRNRIMAFASLPFASLSRISLQHAVDEIGLQKDPS